MLHLDFSYRGHRLAASIDEGRMDTGLLIVSGGNELRSGAHRGMAKLAARLALDGFPVFRFARRGVRHREGKDGGFLSSRPAIAEAVAAFLRARPGQSGREACRER